MSWAGYCFHLLSVERMSVLEEQVATLGQQSSRVCSPCFLLPPGSSDISRETGSSKCEPCVPFWKSMLDFCPTSCFSLESILSVQRTGRSLRVRKLQCAGRNSGSLISHMERRPWEEEQLACGHSKRCSLFSTTGYVGQRWCLSGFHSGCSFHSLCHVPGQMRTMILLENLSVCSGVCLPVCANSWEPAWCFVF